MNKVFFIVLFLLSSFIFAQKQSLDLNKDNNEELNMMEEKIEPSVDCLILEDENSIICKFKVNRDYFEKNITVQWINPLGEVSRTRDMIIPSNHSSIYDYRYIEGREKGEWTFKIILNEKEYSTKFKLK